MSKPIRVIARKPVFTASLFEVSETEIETRSGKRHLHHQIDKDGVVSIFPVTEQNEIILIKQYRYLHEKYITEEIAGYINKGEHPLDAAKRELAEEGGLTARKWHRLAVVDLSASVVMGKYYLYVAKELTQGTAAPEDDEEITLMKFPIDQAVTMVMKNEIHISISMLGVFLVNKYLKGGSR